MKLKLSRRDVREIQKLIMLKEIFKKSLKSIDK